MSHSKQEDSVLLNIKCNYIRRNHRKLIQKDSPGRLPRSTYLKLYQQLMLPAVQLDRLTDVELRQYSRRKSLDLAKTELKSEIEKQRFPSKNIAESKSVYDFECDAYERRTAFCQTNLRSPPPAAGVGSALNKEKTDGKGMSAVQVKPVRSSLSRLDRPRHSNGVDRTNPRRRNPYAVIYKFLKGHRHLQSKLLATYKGTNSTRVAPFKIVINASSAGCKMRKIPLARSDGLSSKPLFPTGTVDHTLVKISSPKAASRTRTNGKTAASNRNIDKRKDFTRVRHRIGGQNVGETKTVDKSVVKSPVPGHVTDLNRKDIHDASTSYDPRHKKRTISPDTEKEPDVTVGFRPSNGTYSSKVKCRNEAWERFNDARWSSVISPRKESLPAKAANKVESEQSKFELRRKSALEVIRDLFYETAASVSSVVSDADNENPLSIGDDKDCNILDSENKKRVECVLNSDDKSEEPLTDRYLSCQDNKSHESDDSDSDAILNVVDQLIDKVTHKVASGSRCDQNVTPQIETKTSPSGQHVDVESSHSLREINYQGDNSLSMSVDSSQDAPASSDVQISGIPKEASSSPLSRRVTNQAYTDSPLSAATEYVRSAYDIKERNDASTESTDITSYGSIYPCYSEIQESVLPEDITVVVEELVGRVCKINDLCSKKVDARCNGDKSKDNDDFTEQDSPTQVEKYCTCEISTDDSCVYLSTTDSYGSEIAKFTECQQRVADGNEHKVTNKTGAGLDHHINGLSVVQKTTPGTEIFPHELSEGNIDDQRNRLLTPERHAVERVFDAKNEANDEQLSLPSSIIKPKACSMQNDSKFMEATARSSESEISNVSSSKSEQKSSHSVDTSSEYCPSSNLYGKVTEQTPSEGTDANDVSSGRSVGEQLTGSSLSSLQLKRTITEAIQQYAASCCKGKDDCGEVSTTDQILSDPKSQDDETICSVITDIGSINRNMPNEEDIIQNRLKVTNKEGIMQKSANGNSNTSSLKLVSETGDKTSSFYRNPSGHGCDQLTDTATEHSDAELAVPESVSSGEGINPPNCEVLNNNNTRNVRRQDEKELEYTREQKKHSTVICKSENEETSKYIDIHHLKRSKERDREQEHNFGHGSCEINRISSSKNCSTDLEASASTDIIDRNVSTDVVLSSLLFNSKDEHVEDVEQETTSVELHKQLLPGRCKIISAESQASENCECSRTKCESSSTTNERERRPMNNDTDTASTKELSDIITATAEERTKSNVDIEQSLHLQTPEGNKSDKLNILSSPGAQHNQGSLTKDEKNFTERPAGDYGAKNVQNTSANGEKQYDDSFNKKAEDLKSIKENTPNVQDETKESMTFPSGSNTKQDSDCQQWENASNDDDGLHIDIPDNDDSVNNDCVCKTEVTIANSPTGDNDKHTLKRKRRKYPLTRKNNKNSSVQITESGMSEKQLGSKILEVECSKESDIEQQEKEMAKRSSSKKAPMRGRKLTKRLENVFSVPNSSSDQHVENKCRKQKKKRKNGDTVLNSEDRLSVEFSKHNWILAKYKTTLQDAASEEQASETVVKTLQTSIKPKCARKRKQVGEEKVGKAKRGRRKQNVDDTTADSMPTPVDVSVVPSGLNSISNDEAGHHNNPNKSPDGNLVQVGDTAIDENDNTGEIKILEVVSLAGYIDQPISNEKDLGSEQNVNDSTDPNVNDHVARSITPEPNQPLNVVVYNSISSVMQLKQDEMLRKNGEDDDTTPLDLRVKPAAETALDLSFKPERKSPAQKAAVGNEEETLNAPLDASYACFNIPKPANSAVSAKRTANPINATSSKPLRPPSPAQPASLLVNPVMLAVANSAAAAAAAAAAASCNVEVIPHSGHHQQKSPVRSPAAIPARAFHTNSPSQAPLGLQATAGDGQNGGIRSRCRSGENAPTFVPQEVVPTGINPAFNAFRGKTVSSSNETFVSQAADTIPCKSLSPGNANVAKTFRGQSTSPNSANTFPGEIMSPINLNPVSQPVNTFHGNNLNTLCQSVSTFPSTFAASNSAVPTLPEPLPAHSCNVLQPGVKNNTQPLHQPMELRATRPVEMNTTLITNPVHGVNITGVLPPALPTEVTPQGRSLKSSAPYVHFSPGVITSDARLGNTAAHPARSMPHTVKHFPHERLHEPANTYSGQFAWPNGEPRIMAAESGMIRHHPDGSEADQSCFIVKPIVSQGMPSYQVAPYNQPVPGAFTTSGESHQHAAGAGFRQQLPRQSGSHLKEFQQQAPKSQQLLLQKQPQPQQPQQQQLQQQQFQRHHELQQLGKLNVIKKPGNSVPEPSNGSASGPPPVSYPGHNMPLPAVHAGVHQPAASSDSNNMLFSTPDGGSVVCTIDSQDMRMVSINCEVCGKKAKFLCSNCKRVAYCSANCQDDTMNCQFPGVEKPSTDLFHETDTRCEVSIG